jgi:hypothetical protein
MTIVRYIKEAQGEDKEEEIQKEGASDTHPIRCPYWKT